MMTTRNDELKWTARTDRRHGGDARRHHQRPLAPAPMRRDGLTRSPSTWTLPPLTAVAALDRDLKKRATHSHLSMR